MENTPSTRQLPRDVFLYFLMIFALGTAAANMGNILFQFINLYVPGEVGYNFFGSAQSAIRFAVSSLVIVFPVLVWVLRFLNRDIKKEPAKRDLKIRKWLLYFTLFVTGIIVIGDLVALVYSFMQGDLTLRFVLKVAVILWLAGSIFYYFLTDLHDSAPKGRKIVSWVSIALVVVSLIVGFAVAGSPASQRARANDERRVADLQSIENQLIWYWQAKGTVPSSLAQLSSTTIGGYVVPVDPKTGQSYEYTPKGSLGYELCATFESTSAPDGQSPTLVAPRGPLGVTTWQHGEGRTCFDGKIDPAFYQPLMPKGI